MKKSLISPLILCVLLSISLAFIACNKTDSSPDTSVPTYLPYDIDTTGTIQRFYANENNSVNVTIPSTYSMDKNGKIIAGSAYEIKSIGAFCFANNTLIESVTIPETVTAIEDMAFYNCSNIQKVNVSKNIHSIGKEVFDQCPKLTIIAPKGTTGITLATNNNLSSFSIPNSITKIEDNSFENWENLTSITIGGNVTHIGNNAFTNCTNLNRVTINTSLSFIGDTAFSGCGNLTTLASNNSNMPYEKYIYFSEPQSVKRFVIPDSITSIQAECFFKWTKLEYISLPQSITYIGTIFNDNNNLTTLICGTSSILSLFTYSYYATETETTYIASHHVIPKTLKEVYLLNDLEDNCFSGMKYLEKVHLPASVSSFGSQTFSGCSRLTNVYMSTDSDWTITTSNNTEIIPQATMNNSALLAALIKRNVGNYFTFKKVSEEY